MSTTANNTKELDKNIPLNNLEEVIVEGRDKVLFREVIGCFSAKSYRAAYIINWIMIVESLRAKFEEVANNDSHIKKQVINKLRKHESEKKVLIDC